MAVRTARVAGRRTASIRRDLILRTARVWSKLNKNLTKELNKITQNWLDEAFKEPENSHEIPIKFTRVLQRTLREALAYGYWLQDLYLFEQRGKKYKGKITLSEGDDIKESLEDFIDDRIWNDIIPEEAVNWINDYVPHLANVFNEDVLNAVRDVTQKSLIEGSTLQERIKALQDAHEELAEMTKHRIEAIARTEITRADSLGRIISAKANDDVIGFEFSAVLDNRTTPYCLERHGLVMRIDDSRLPENTPPLHVHCRSLLNPLTIYDYPDGLLTSHEFDEISAGKQRPDDVEIIRELLYGHDYYAKKSSKLKEYYIELDMSEEEWTKLHQKKTVKKKKKYNSEKKYKNFWEESSDILDDLFEEEVPEKLRRDNQPKFW